MARVFGPDGREAADVPPHPGGVIAADPPALALMQALTAEGPFRVGGVGPAPEAGPEPVFETLTSGSSGAPRRIRRTQGSWTASFAVNARLFVLGPGRRVAVLGALVHSLALYGALEGAHLGAEVHLLAGLRPDRQATEVARRGVDTVYATPAQLRAMLAGMPSAVPHLSGLRLVLVGGSKLDDRLRAALRAAAPGAEVREFYGAAEASFITLADEGTPPASVGRRYPGVDLAVRGGEVWVKSPYLFEGYASDPGGAEWRDGWLSVGEMGRLDGEFLYLDGRKGRMVTVADQNVFPEAVEAFLEGLPGVTRAAVLAVPDADRGHVLRAVCQGDAAVEAVVMAALRAEFGPMKAPRRIDWREDWPVLPSGKTDLRALEGEG